MEQKMNTDLKQLSKTFFVGANEANAQQTLALTILTANIIDVATAHANQLHLGNPDMTDVDGGWVLTRLTIEMQRWPAVNTEYTLTTWIETINRHFSERVFEMTDSKGDVLGHARSIWMIIDTVNHTNLGISHFDLSKIPVRGDEVPITRQGRHRPILMPEEAEGHNNVLTATAPVRKYTFKYCDIDCYRHVNTVRYITLLLNQFSLDQMDTHRLQRMELSFMHEARYGMTVDIMSAVSTQDNQYIFTLCQEDNHLKPLLFSKIVLVPNH